MGLWNSLSGAVTVEIISAALPSLLSDISAFGVGLLKISSINELTVRCEVKRRDFQLLASLVEIRGGEISVRKKQGLFWTFTELMKRPVLVAGIILMVILALYLPTRILFVQVEGNATVPSQLILEKADICGIRMLAKRQMVRSEKVKNRLLESIPELQWAGVNTRGCIAVISVKEKSEEKESEEQPAVSSIVAHRDGIIRSCTVLRGNALCTVGQAVKTGQTLVSGYTDYGLTIRATNAQAEIMAQTNHDVSAIAPAAIAERGGELFRERKISIKIGKKLIKFNNDSGISDTTCVKIYQERQLTLPGGFQLPISLITEEVIYHELKEPVLDESEDLSWVSKSVDAYLLDHMIAGRILKRQTSIDLTGDRCCLSGQYACLEMIGRVRVEEFIQNNGKSD
jgi:sporulation protein YqfD